MVDLDFRSDIRDTLTAALYTGRYPYVIRAVYDSPVPLSQDEVLDAVRKAYSDEYGYPVSESKIRQEAIDNIIDHLVSSKVLLKADEGVFLPQVIRTHLENSLAFFQDGPDPILVRQTRSIFAGVGSHNRVDHVAIQTGRGRMKWAIQLFIGLGFIHDPELDSEGDWGVACFLFRQNSVPIQLTESTDSTLIPVVENHVAITVDDPKQVAEVIVQWAKIECNVSAFMEEVGVQKYFVTIPAIITVSIELVLAAK